MICHQLTSFIFLRYDRIFSAFLYIVIILIQWSILLR
jgi:hypothetical protein